MSAPTAIERVEHFLDVYRTSYAAPKGTLHPDDLHGLGTADGVAWLRISDLLEVVALARQVAADSPSYDEVIAEAKRMGLDPYGPDGEYRPGVIEQAQASLAERLGS